MNTIETKGKSRNADPITKAPGSHPVGTGLGAAAGGMAAGAAIGTVAGPVGTIAGAAVGAIVGGLAGKGIAEAINPTLEAKHWKENHAAQPYSHLGPYEDFDPAYRVSYESYPELGKQYSTFDEAEPELRKRYHSKNPKMKWEDVSPASRAAWNRIIAQREIDKKNT